MYVCICNALTQRAVETAVAAGASSPRAVYAHHGCRPQCGKCVGCIRTVCAARADATDAQDHSSILAAASLGAGSAPQHAMAAPAQD